MDLSKNYKPSEFSLNTKKHGIIDFSYLSVWRETLIIKNTKNLQDIEPIAFCLIVAKYLISKKENVIYDEEFYKTIKTHNDIKLILEKDEIDNFSKEFVSIYISEISHYTDINNNENIDNHKIIKNYFKKINEDFIKLVEETTKFTKLGFDNKIFDQVKKISELSKIAFPKVSSDELSRISEAAKVFSGIPSSELSKLSEAAKAISGIQSSEISKLSEAAQNAIKMFPFDKIAKINDNYDLLQKPTNVDIPHFPTAPIIPHHVELDVLCEIRDLFTSFKTNFSSFKEYIKSMLEVTNTTINNIRDSIELQINENAKTSNKAYILSIIAIFIAIAVGAVQIYFSLNSNKHTDKMNYNIEQLNNTIIELNTANKNYLEKIESLTNELIFLKENKNHTDDEVQQIP